MKTHCAPDNFYCLVQNLPDTLDTLGIIAGVAVLAAIGITAIFAEYMGNR